MWRALAVLAACGFHGPTPVAGDGPLSGDGATSPDSTAATDAGHADAATIIDAPPPCTKHPNTTHVSPGFIGGPSGGNAGSPITCMGDGVPVGLEIYMTQGKLGNHGNMPAVVAISVQCGTITGATTAVGEVVNRIGGVGNCTGYDAPIASGILRCPQGTAISAIDANELDVTLYNTVVVTCSDGSALPFPSSGAFANHPEHVECAAGTVVAGFDVRSACGQDQLQLECAMLTCD